MVILMTLIDVDSCCLMFIDVYNFLVFLMLIDVGFYFGSRETRFVTRLVLGMQIRTLSQTAREAPSDSPL